MHPDEIIRQLEAGRLDVDAALALFQRLGSAPKAPACAATGPLRLRPVDARPAPAAPAAPPARVRLARLAEAAPPPSAAMDPVVRLNWPEPGIAVVALEDRDHQNMFTEALVRDLFAVFAQIRQNPAARVVVIHGADTWFCAGGLPDQLESIRTGEATFSDSGGFFRLLLDCDLPTIAAVQGHALGGGLTFALYADLVILAEHAFYAGNFMAHSLTPGVGATLMFPLRFGRTLGTEMLFTARRYRGGELRTRGAPMAVVPGDEVIPTAMGQARLLAAMARPQLELLKRRLRGDVLAQLPAALDEELAMHRALFGEHRG